GAKSKAKDLVIAIMAPFDALYAGLFCWPTKPFIDPIFIIVPLFSFKSDKAYLIHRNILVKLISIKFFHLLVFMSSILPGNIVPALLKRVSILPYISCILLIKLLTSFSSDIFVL